MKMDELFNADYTDKSGKHRIIRQITLDEVYAAQKADESLVITPVIFPTKYGDTFAIDFIGKNTSFTIAMFDTYKAMCEKCADIYSLTTDEFIKQYCK